jgi:NAD(P)H-hydrate epimerase
MRAADEALIERIGVPGRALMEVAAQGVVRSVMQHHAADAARGVVVAVGPGNNGGDGWAVARLLAARGVPCSVWPVDEPGKPDSVAMAHAADRAGVPRVDGPEGAALVVDAVLGNGVARPVEGPRAAALARLGAAGRPVVAVDLPSGLCADTGRRWGPVPRAATTVALGALKRGMFAGDGPDLCGRVEAVDLGMGGVLCTSAECAVGAPVSWPVRPASAHKRTSGTLGIWAGSAAMAGAAVLACRGALAGGAGLVTLATPGRRPAGLPAEVMWRSSGRGDVSEAPPDWSIARVWVVGPGLGGGGPLLGGVAEALRVAWAMHPGPMVYDADALLPDLGVPGGPRVRTPHAGEAARLLGLRPADIDADRFGAARALADQGGVAVLKGRGTLVAEGGARTRVHPVGGPVLATGGTGDVLAGLIGALLAAGLPAFSAASLAVWTHGRAGDRLAARRPVGVTASDVARALPAAAREAL